MTLLASLLPPSAVACEEFADVPGEAPFPGEEDLIATAVEGRRREFVTARRCARQALATLDVAAAPIRSGPRREPLWPTGIVGSITHCRGYRAAAVARRDDLAALGIDAEPDGPLPDGVEPSLTLPAERLQLRRLEAEAPGPHWGRVLFSAKESIYKAWYPVNGRWLGFEEAELTIDPAAGTFHARLLADGGPLLSAVDGRFVIARGLVVTAVAIAR